MKYALIGLLFLSTANAGINDDIYAYRYIGRQLIKTYAEQINASAPANLAGANSANSANKCLPLYKNVLRNKVLDILYALGYFDDTRGVDIRWNNKNWGYSPSLDIGIFHSIRDTLTERCKNKSQLNLCGFSETGDPKLGKVMLQKQVQIHGEDILVRIALTHASASESFIENTRSQNQRQAFLTKQSEENYFGGIGLADVVIYNGHSRNGGGPDFNPPILDGHMKTDYNGYYEIQRPGIRRVLDLVQTAENRESVLAFFSCYSKKHFYKDILLANPEQRLILSAETIDYYDSLKASVGYLEGFMRGACGQDLADIAKQGDRIKNGFQGFQIK